MVDRAIVILLPTLNPRVHTKLTASPTVIDSLCIPLNSYVEILTPQCDGIRRCTLWEVIRPLKSGVLLKGINAVIKEKPQRALLISSYVWGHSLLWTRKWVFSRHLPSAGSSISFFPAFRTSKNVCCLCYLSTVICSGSWNWLRHQPYY